ncbi:hypothetical protein M4D68_00985 [Priestia aryabhattai]|uniref:hypothetical protein n=1 Tax=Priestia aryabhattai TaxID=412384 RepID=UPI00203F7E5E|nr:hypothetical protein [Priestia aryabhattai]MCM3639720.1 hypothetical protein [Priestia aryabhattai]
MKIGQKVDVSFRGSKELMSGKIREYNDRVVILELNAGADIILDRQDVVLTPTKLTTKKKNNAKYRAE